MNHRRRATSAWRLVLASALVLGACSDEATTTDEGAVEAPVVEGLGYRFELVSAGDDARHRLVTTVPVGREVGVEVRLSSENEDVELGLVATVVRADADGESEDIELRIVSVDADDRSTEEGLAPVLDATSVVRRDRLRAVVDQVLDIPAGLSFRADAVARQALRAPFALSGPLPVQAVGDGASWTVTTTDGPTEVGSRDVELVDVGSEGYRLRSEVPDGSIEIVGRPGQLLPTEQIIRLSDAELTITAEEIR